MPGRNSRSETLTRSPLSSSIVSPSGGTQLLAVDSALMLTAHRLVAVAVVAVTALAFLVGAFVYWRRLRPGFLTTNLLVLAQTLLVAQVGLGLLLLSDERRAADRLHYAYGTLALLAVLSPWVYAPVEPRRRLAWFVGATLVGALLAGRAYMTSG
jgi:hypothetical protein